MFIKGRDCLDDEAKLIEVAKDDLIQRHIPNPHLTTDGNKWHFKLYNLLVSETSEENESSWTLRCHDEAYFCAASTTPEARIKRLRIGRVIEELGGDVDMYEIMLNKCTEMAASVIGRAIEMKKLEGRQGKKQFEIFSSDFMFDTTLEKAHLIEVSQTLGDLCLTWYFHLIDL